MFKVLLKKQFLELNKFYYQNTKTGQRRSKKSAVTQVILFAFIMLIVAASFFAVSMGLVSAFHPVGLDWLYFFIMGLLSILLGAFGSVFNTYASLYKPSDNDLLFSLPIKTDTIIAARFVSVYLMGLMYEALVIVPALVVYWIKADADIIGFIIQFAMIFVIGLLVLAISVALGYVVALLSSKIKSKAFISVISSVLILVLYYFIYFKAQNMISAVAENSAYYAGKIKDSTFFFYHLGNGMAGDIKSLLISCSLILLLCVIVCAVLRKSFFKLSTENAHTKSKKRNYKYSASNSNRAFVYKELKGFSSSSVYMMNMGLGLVFMIAAGVLLLVKSQYVNDFFNDESMSTLANIVPFIAGLTVTMLCGMSCITSPSISLEGQNFWLLKTLPVSPQTVFNGKINANTLLCTPPAVISVILISVALKYSFAITVLSLLFVFVYIRFLGRFGLITNLKHYNFEWTNEAVPIKQGISVFFSMLMSFALTILFAGLSMAVSVDAVIYYLISLAVIVLLDFVCMKWLNTKGVKIFNLI